MSQLARLFRKFLFNDSWMTVALYMGTTYQHCERIYRDDRRYDSHYSENRCRLRALSDWLNREDGTGDLPRTRDTVLKAFKKLLPSEPGLSKEHNIAEALQILMED